MLFFTLTLLSFTIFQTGELGNDPATSKQMMISQQMATPGFSIYCLSNLDGTGSCMRVDNNEAVPCTIVPGGIISCSQNAMDPIQCVSYGSSSDTQSYFYCTRRTDPGIKNNRLNTNRFGSTINFGSMPSDMKQQKANHEYRSPPGNIQNQNPLNPIQNPFINPFN